MGPLDSVIFGKKKFSNILEEIYNNQKRKETQIISLINELKPLVTEIGDATLLVPLIAQYLEISVKNDDALIKMATIVQRILQNKSEGGGELITDEEKRQLLKAVEEHKAFNDGK